MKLSVILCTHNPREEYVHRTLAGLQVQTLPPDQWEFIFIDNASKAPLSDRYDLSWHPNGRHLLEPKLGKLNAWMLGITEARGDILIFVDDDNVLASDFLEQAIKIGEEWPFIGAWGGKIVPEFAVPVPAWCGAQIWRLTVVDVKEDVWSNIKDEFKTIPAGAGMCVRKLVADRYINWCAENPQRAKLDRSGTGLGGYGDVDLAYCALDAGLGTALTKRLSLTHLIPASRLTLDYFVRHAEGDAFSLTLFQAGRGLPVQKPYRMNWFSSLRWFLHRQIHRVPREQYEIAKAHQRGLEKGWEMIQKYDIQNDPPVRPTVRTTEHKPIV